MNARAGWFEVDRAGLARVAGRRTKTFILRELIQNSWDEASTVVSVEVHRPGNGSGFSTIRVTDDSPEGFATLSHAYTLFAPSAKVTDATKRGRFNFGEKLVLALCSEARIETTKGTVLFERGERRRRSPKRREAGSMFEGQIKLNAEEREALVKSARQMIPPGGKRTLVNGEEVFPRKPVVEYEHMLYTEIAKDDGMLRTEYRTAKVRVYEALPGEKPSLYEMGIPLVETGDRWHVDVCVAPETRILTADLRYIPADDVSVGMKLIGFDEERVGHRRRFRTSTVKNVERILRPSYRLTFDDGTVITCSEDHQWLTAWSKTRRWQRTKDMIPTRGRRPGSNVVRLFDTWETERSYTAGYLAAAFDGEGCLIQRPASGNPDGVVNRLGFVQKNNGMLAQMRALLSDQGFPFHDVIRKDRTNPNWEPCAELSLRSREDIVKFLGRYRPARLLPKFRPEGLGTITTGRAVKLIKKEFIGVTEVIAIETSTRTYIAEGLASHNCQKVPLNMERDNVSPAYLRDVRVSVANHTRDMLTTEDANAPWARDALADYQVEPETVKRLVNLRFGDKVVVHDPSDQEANQKAQSEGYVVVTGSQLSGEEWSRVRNADAMLPAGRLFPTPKGFHEDGAPLKTIERADWTAGMLKFERMAHAVAEALIERAVAVVIADDRGWDFEGAFSENRLIINAAPFGGAAAFDHMENDYPSFRFLEFLIHEYAHDVEANHLSAKYHDTLCKFGGKMARLALDRPEVFR